MIVSLSYLITEVFMYPIFWLLVFSVLALHWYTHSPKLLPPRPCSWPIVGNLFTVPSDVPLYRWCQEQTRRHGPIIRVSQGLTDMVVLNDKRSIHEAMVEKNWQFSGRPLTAAFEVLDGDYSNVSFTDPDHPTWKLRRKMLVTSLRNFTTGELFETRVKESLSKLIKIFDEMAEKNEAFDPEYSLKLFVYNNTAAMCYGKSFDFDDEEFGELHDANQAFADAVGKTYSTDVIPALKWLPFDMPDLAKLKKEMGAPITGFVERNFEEHLQNPSDDSSDLTYHLIKQKRESTDPLMKDITNVNIREIVSDIFNAATDTTRGTVQWLLLCLSHRPDVQNKLYQEIQDVIGNTTNTDKPLLSFRPLMEYTDAVITECIRFGTVAPMGLPRKTMEDTKLGIYDIPKGTQVFMNLYAVNHDSEDFPDPCQFKPERFLNQETETMNKQENGTTVMKIIEKNNPPRPPQLSFGLGRRICPGESSAKSTIWLILIILTERYQFFPDKKLQLNDMYGLSLFDGSPKTFKIRAVRRH